MRTIYLILLIQFFFFSPIFEVKTEISPELKLHENLGCPLNSTCDDKSGMLFAQYDEIVRKINYQYPNPLQELQKFVQENGVPFDGWTKIDEIPKISKLNPIRGAHWPSRHEEIKDYEESTVFFKKEIPKEKFFMGIPVLSTKPDISFIIGRASHPYYVDPQLKFIYTHIQIGSHYATLRHSSPRSFSLLNYQKQEKAKEEKVECSKELIAQFKIFQAKEENKMWKNYDCFRYEKQGPVILIPTF